MSTLTNSKLKGKSRTSMQKQKKYVYFFGRGAAEGNAQMKQLLGGKGANLAEMMRIGVPVPPGFTISTEACAAFYELNKKWPVGLEAEVNTSLEKLEAGMGAKS